MDRLHQTLGQTIAEAPEGEKVGACERVRGCLLGRRWMKHSTGQQCVVDGRR